MLNRDQVGGDNGSTWRWHFWWNTLLRIMRHGVVVPSVVVVTMASGKSTPENGGRREGNKAVFHDCKQERS